jgi:ABC-type nitrate/sulfonate/bicarbonate transport system substrate-binding protein
MLFFLIGTLSPLLAQAASPEKVSVRLAWLYDMAEAGIFVAKEYRYFEKEGLEVTIEPGGFGLDPIKLVAAGSNDFGVGGAGNLLLARSRGVPVVAVGVEFQNTAVGFITRKQSGIAAFRDFKGKRVGIQTGADTDVLYRTLLARNHMTSRDVREVPIQYDMGPFVNGAIDVLPGYVTNQPITLAGKGVETNVITAASQGLNYYGNVYFVSEDKLKANPDQVARFVRALQAGWTHALANKGDAIATLRKYTKEFDPKDLDRIYDAVMPFVEPDEPGIPRLGMSMARWQTTADVLIGAGLLKQVPDLARAYITQFVQ